MRTQMFLVNRYGATWKATNPSKDAIRKAVKGMTAGGYAVELRRQPW